MMEDRLSDLEAEYSELKEKVADIPKYEFDIGYFYGPAAESKYVISISSGGQELNKLCIYSDLICASSNDKIHLLENRVTFLEDEVANLRAENSELKELVQEEISSLSHIKQKMGINFIKKKKKV